MIRQALVLTAGLGTRLRPLTDVRAKAAIPVAGVPMIRRIIAWLVSSGVRDLVLNLHHLPETLAAVVGDGSDLGARVRYSWEQPHVLGSAGGPRLAVPLIDGDTFLLVNGDTLTDVDLGALSTAHAASDALVTLALVPNREFERYGGVQVDAGGTVIGFVRRGPAAAGSYHFIGVQAAHATAFDGVKAGTPAESIGEVYDALIAARPGSVRAFVCNAAFWDVGTAADYWRTSRAFASSTGAGPSELGLAPRVEGPTVGRGTRIDASARIDSSILWDDVEVAAGAVLEECIVADGVSIPPGAHYTRSVIVGRDDGSLAVSPIGAI